MNAADAKRRMLSLLADRAPLMEQMRELDERAEANDQDSPVQADIVREATKVQHHLDVLDESIVECAAVAFAADVAEMINERTRPAYRLAVGG